MRFLKQLLISQAGNLWNYIKRLYLAVSNNNVIIPGGAQDTGDGRFNIEVPGVFETAQDVYSI